MSNFDQELQEQILKRFGTDALTDYEPYHKEYLRLQALIDTNRQLVNERQQEIEKQVVRWEYGIGGNNLPRGYYSPSIIEHIVIANAKRGRICKTKRPSNPSFAFGFDADDRLIIVKQENRTEAITYNGNVSFGITATDDHIETVTECIYDENNKLIQLRFLIDQTELTLENYRYEENSMFVQRDIYSVGFMVSQNRYRFTVNGDRLVDYTIEQFDGENLTSQPLNGRYFKVL